MPNAHAVFMQARRIYASSFKSSMSREVKHIFPYSGCRDAASGVDVRYDFMPGGGVRDGKINGVAFPDVA